MLTLISGHRVRAVPMDAPGTGYEVTGPEGSRLLYLPPGAAPAGLTDRVVEPYDLVACDVVGRPDAVARLRAAGAIGPATEIVAVHLGHDAPPGAELDRRLAAAGARAVPDGTTLVLGEYRAAVGVPRRTLVTGGARSGKSVEAERRLETFPEVVYVATGGGREGTPSGRPGSACTGSAGRPPGAPRRPVSWRSCWSRTGPRS